MALALQLPSTENIIDALVDKVVAAANGPTTFLYTTLLPYGVTFDVTTVSPIDTGTTTTGSIKKKYVKFGTRGGPIPGLSVQFFPDENAMEYAWAPNGEQSEVQLRVISSWCDTPTQKLTANPDMVSRMMVTFTEALKMVIGPANLVSGQYAGYWSPLNDLNTISRMLVTSATLNAWVKHPQNASGELIHYSELVWSAWRYGTP